jgi:SAM-dependent methyltransferase
MAQDGTFDRRAMLRAWAAHDAEIYRAFADTITRLSSRSLRDLKILDLGCGSNAPMTVLLHAGGCRVTGVDAYLGYRWGLGFRPRRFLSYAKEAGLLKTLRKIAGEIAYDRVYFQELAARTGLTLTDRGLDLRQMDIQAPALPASAFDAVHSNATWEHIADVRAANRAVADALVPGGLAYIEIHLFPSLSGGHDLPWIVPGSTLLGDVRPWQHLRDPNWKAPVFLNRLRESDYRSAFENTASLEIEEWRTEFVEGRDLLTPEIRASLPGFSEEELTKRSIIVVARRTA